MKKFWKRVAAAAVKTDEVSEERLDESVRRILTLKEKAGLSLDVPQHTVARKRKDFFERHF